MATQAVTDYGYDCRNRLPVISSFYGFQGTTPVLDGGLDYAALSEVKLTWNQRICGENYIHVDR